MKTPPRRPAAELKATQDGEKGIYRYISANTPINAHKKSTLKGAFSWRFIRQLKRYARALKQSAQTECYASHSSTSLMMKLPL
ncbi:hypothetical protein L1D44_20840 [Shewanella sp. Isolate13]|uniref:hypothetical protein n=1 Tax=Shewanella sp. Isolate13 TaxID=2908531 RepID=UPI001EFD173D|nr:hypothetical protein [Shewanella sp. Isolate13]MCG9732231.1 hypothetical protein [Shewanella sp. Isolate13]